MRHSCGRHQRFSPKRKVLVDFCVCQYRRITYFLRLFQKLLYAFHAGTLIIQKRRIDIEYAKQSFQLCHGHLRRSGKEFEFVKIEYIRPRYFIQIRCCQCFSSLQRHDRISVINHGKEDYRHKDKLNLEMLINILIHKSGFKNIGVVDNTLRRQFFQHFNEICRILGVLCGNLVPVQNTKACQHIG